MSVLQSSSRSGRILSADPWRLAAALVLTALAVAVLATFRDYGISWDEPVQHTYGEDLLDFYTSDFRDREALSYMNLFFYGGFFDLIAAILDRILPFGTYATRHLWGGVVFLAGVAGAGRLAALLAGPRAGFLAVLLLGVNALLYGHGFINPKDGPLAWLLVWVMYFAARALIEGTPRTATLVGFGISVGLALGTRILAAPMVGYVACAILFGAVVHRLRPTAPAVTRAGIGLAAALPLAYGVMVLCWPWAIQRPWNPVLALHEFTNFPWVGSILWNGHTVSSAHLPRSYLAVLLWFQLSEAILLGLLFAAVAGAARFARLHFGVLDDRRCLPILILIAAAVVPLVGFAILTPTIYNGLRHFLFVVPPLGILAALGWDAALSALAARRPALVPAALTLLAALVVLQIAPMIRLHPYQYIAYNRLLGGVRGAVGRFELDYWDVSFREAAAALGRHVAQTGETAPVVFVCGNRLSAEAFLPKTVRVTYRLEEADYLISNVPSPCAYLMDMDRGRVLEVRRDGVVLSFVIDLRAPRQDTAAPGNPESALRP